MPDPKLDIKISTAADTRGAGQASKALDGVAQAGERAGKAGAKWINSTTEAAQQGSKALDGLKQGGENVGKVFGGLAQASRGGIGGLVGLTNAARGLVAIFRTLSAGAIGGVVGAIGLLGGALIGVGKLFLDTKAQVDAARDGLNLSSKSAEEFAKELKELEATAEKSLQKHLAEVQKLSQGYNELLSRMDAAEKQAARRNELSDRLAMSRLDLEEKKALAGAATDEARAKIQKTFSERRTALQRNSEDVAADNAVLAAGVRNDNAAVTISGARSTITSAEMEYQAAVRQREALEVDAYEAAKGVRSASTPMQQAKANQFFDNANGALRNARAAEQAAFDNVQRVTIEAQQVITTAENEIQAATTTKQEAPILQQVTQNQRAAESYQALPALTEPSTERTQSLEAQVKALGDAQFADRTFGGNPRLNQQLAAATAALAESKAADEKALSVFTSQVQAAAASRRKMAREMEKANTRANDSRP